MSQHETFDPDQPVHLDSPEVQRAMQTATHHLGGIATLEVAPLPDDTMRLDTTPELRATSEQAPMYPIVVTHEQGRRKYTHDFLDVTPIPGGIAGSRENDEGRRISRSGSEVLVTNKRWATALQEKGLRAFDDLPRSTYQHDLSIVSLGGDTGYSDDRNNRMVRVSFDPDSRLVTSRIFMHVPVESQLGELPRVSDEEPRETDSLGDIVGPQGTTFMLEKLFEDSQRLQTIYEQLGFEQSSLDAITFPIPSELLRRWNELRAQQDLPDLKLISGSHKLGTEPYIRAFAEGKFPVSTDSATYYMHDVASDHLMTLIACGPTLMDFMQTYAQTILEQGTGAKTATANLDNITTDLGYDTVVHNSTDSNVESSIFFNVAFRTIAEGGKLGALSAAQELLKRGTVQAVEEITPLLLYRWFIEQGNKVLDKKDSQ